MEVEYPTDKTIQLLFEEQVEKSPDCIALVFEDQQLTYRELNIRANQLAHYIRHIYKTTYFTPLPPDTLIALCIERSLEMVIAILAILKAGAAYVPLEPNFPQERLHHILKDIQAPLLVTNSANLKHLSFYEGGIICLDCEQEIFSSTNIANPNVTIQTNNLAYIIYTSGSTGKPKGVMIEHSSIYNVVIWGIKHLPVLAGQKLLHTNSYSFDASVYNLFQPLACGATILLVSSENIFNLNHLVNLIIEHQISLIKGTPSVVLNLLDHQKLINNPQITDIICGAEPFSLELLQKAKNVKGRKVYNLYGPTETAVFSTYYQADKCDATAHSNFLPIGLPIANTRLYIIDFGGSLCPIGAAGELYIGGAGLARGYLNRPELTEEKFITNQFATEEEKKQGKNLRLYRTGDLARWLPDGNLEYLGRIDQQVKIRGYRIELGEIEQALLTHPSLNQAVVTDHESETGKQLVAYIIKDQKATVTPEELRKYLSKSLPEYMLPSIYITLESFPLTNNGKLDRKALPKPDQSMIRSEIGYTAPRNIIEEKLAEIWGIVLKRDKIGIYDNFFMIGGHSLLATQVISRVRNNYNIDIPLRVLFEHPTIEGLSKIVESLHQDQAALPVLSIVAGERGEHLPLSFAQERLWFIDKFNQDGTASYNIPIALRLKGSIDKVALENSIQDIIDRHESLRTAFIDIDGVGRQVIYPTMKLAISWQEVSQLGQEEIERIVNEEATTYFDLSKGPLIRVQLLILGEEEHILLLTMHHIVSDGWSMGIFFEELSLCYKTRAEGRVPELPKLTIQYADFAQWQKKWLQGEILERQLDYWKERLKGYENLNLPLDYPRPAQQSFAGSHYVFKISGELSKKLQELAQQYQGTLFTVLLAAFNVLLSRYSGQTDIVIGTPIANRHLPEVEKLIGFFVNTLAIRTKFSSQDTFSNLLLLVTREALEAYEHQDVPFEKLVDALQVERDLSRSPIFQVMLVLQNANDTKGLSLSEVEISRAKQHYNVAKFDLALTLRETEDELVGVIEYNTDIFKEETIARLSENFKVLLGGIVENPQQAICQLPLLTEREKKQILTEWNATEHEYPADKTIHQLFEEQVEKTPDSIALVFEDQQLTYHELNKRANQLAHYITACYESNFQHPVMPDTLIALCIDRGLDLVIAILAILKAGAAYVPIDPTNPDDRIKHILQDTETKLVLTNACYQDRLANINKSQRDKKKNLPFEIMALDSPNIRKLYSLHLFENLNTKTLSDNLAYVIYTSGTTGVPKGVLIEHCNVIRLFIHTDNWYKFNNNDVWSLFHSYAFDFTVWELWGALLEGGRLVIVPYYTSQDTQDFYQLVAKEQVTILNQTPSAFENFIIVDRQYSTSKLALRYVIFGGEALNINKLKCWWDKYGDTLPHLINMYGITETTVHVTYYALSKQDLNSSTRNTVIGKQIEDLKCYIVSEGFQLCPIGAAGELYIGGAGLARGYLNRPELTEEKFITNQFATEEEKKQGKNLRLYRTGDLARWLPDGNLEYLGRIDQQVKIRGYRIELGEIEQALLTHPSLNQAVVTDHESETGKQLVAYIIKDQKATVTPEELRKYLSKSLPEYMLPSIYITLESFPLTNNGKLDRKALPKPDQSMIRSEIGYTAPRNIIEEKLAEIWGIVLKRDKIGIYDNFFMIGGHSLLATQVISRVRNNYNIDIPLRVLFEHPTIEGLSKIVESLHQDQAALPVLSIVAGERGEHLPLSFAQERLWFIDKFNQDGTASYNIPIALRLKGSIDKVALENSIQDIIDRHESLRTAFIDIDGVGRQVIYPTMKLAISWQEVSQLGQEEIERIVNEEATTYFDLSKGPLIRVQLLILGEEEHILLLTMHHIVSDGWSMGIFFEELSLCYKTRAEGRVPELPKLTIQYADFAQWQKKWLQGEILERQLDYWKERLKGYENLNLPLDYPRPAQQSFAGSHYVFKITGELSKKLQELAQQYQGTLFTVLLAAFNVLLSRYSGQTDIVIGTPIANRHLPEVEKLIGFFVNVLAVRTTHNPDDTFAKLLQKVTREALEGYEHQDVPLEKLMDALQIERGASRSPLFQVMLDLQNANEKVSLSLPGINISEFPQRYNMSKFGLTLMLQETEDELVGVVEYNTDIFKEETIVRLSENFKVLLGGITENPEQAICQLPLLTEKEKKQILTEWNATEHEYPADKTIHQLFEEQVEKTPDSIAVLYENKELSYRELNEKANQLAHCLKNNFNLKADELVILCLDRSEHMLIAILAVLKAGGAYVPIDPNYPAERIKYILEDTKSKICLTNLIYQRELVEILINKVEIIAIDDLRPQELSKYASSNPIVKAKSTNLAYVIYTSGTTGNPKGVMIEHKSVVNYILNVKKSLNLTATDIVDFSTNIGFDLSVTTTLSSLCLGCQVVIYPQQLIDLENYQNYLIRNNINVIKLVPSYFELLIEYLPHTKINKVILGGEKLNPNLITKIQKSYNQQEELAELVIYDEYGPTETTVGACISQCYPNGSYTIGKPYNNYQIYIVDANTRLLPIGAAGELYIGGAGLARGYLNRPELTEEKFITNPFATEEEKKQGKNLRLYRTGDLARWLPDGNLEYLGRIDQQVKIRGYRIELGEIEQALLTHPSLNQAVVMDHESETGKQLVAYIIKDQKATVTPEELRKYLSKSLPEYMLPSIYITLESFPLTNNGKLDRKALPKPNFIDKQNYVKPRNDLEHKICQIWAETLRLDQNTISLRDDFFGLGGNSLLAIEVISKMNKQLNSNINVSALFECSVLEELAKYYQPISAEIGEADKEKWSF